MGCLRGSLGVTIMSTVEASCIQQTSPHKTLDVGCSAILMLVTPRGPCLSNTKSVGDALNLWRSKGTGYHFWKAVLLATTNVLIIRALGELSMIKWHWCGCWNLCNRKWAIYQQNFIVILVRPFPIMDYRPLSKLCTLYLECVYSQAAYQGKVHLWRLWF